MRGSDGSTISGQVSLSVNCEQGYASCKPLTVLGETLWRSHLDSVYPFMPPRAPSQLKEQRREHNTCQLSVPALGVVPCMPRDN